MSELRLNFLNWRPDIEDTEHDGLTVANNVVHDPSGYKPTFLRTASAFSTTGGLAASAATVESIMAKPVGNQGDLFCAWLANDTLHVGINGLTATSTATGYPLTWSGTMTSQGIYAFDVCEYADKIFFTVEARGEQDIVGAVSIKHLGYMGY